MPAGFTVVAFESGTSAACPTGFTKASTDVEEGPNVPANACACDGTCSVATQPSCPSRGTIAIAYDTVGDGSCRSTGMLANTSTCNTDTGQVPVGSNVDIALTPPAPTGGTCTAPSPTMHAERVTYAGSGRICTPNSDASAGCANGVCSTSVPSPFKVCIAAPGNVSCPSAPPFTTKHDTITGVTFSCVGTCGCSITGTCSGVVLFATGTSCVSTQVVDLAADGVCASVPNSEFSTMFGSYGYTPGSTGNVACRTQGAAQPPSNVSNQDEVTLCCAP